jgi:alkanesulfonate monooxygenase SsuD/methylene tetrahydromethanopterin reductase-like flavin-dependent oxidoreductase (luciferase family)
MWYERVVRYAISAPNVGRPTDLVSLAKAAEDGGWDGFFLWDHLHFVRATQLDIVDPWVTLGAIAQATERIRLGAMVTPLPRRRPWKLAKEITTLDHLSAGRVIVGVGLGSPPDDEFAAFGEPSADATRAGLLDEGLVVLDGCLRGGPFRHTGSAFDVDVDFHPAPVQRPRPPIWVAATLPNRRPIERARRFDGVFPIAVSGEPLRPGEIAALVADLDVAPGFDVVAPWADGVPAVDYEAAGATWLIDSRWPEGEWRDELAGVADRGPRR